MNGTLNYRIGVALDMPVRLPMSLGFSERGMHGFEKHPCNRTRNTRLREKALVHEYTKSLADGSAMPT